MSPEIGAQRQFIERRGGPTYDWNQTTLTIDTTLHALDLSSIVPSNAAWVKFHAIATAGGESKAFWLGNKVINDLNHIHVTIATGPAGTFNHQFFMNPGSPQTCAYLIQVGITALTIRVLGWML